MSLILLEGFDDGLRESRWTTDSLPAPGSSSENRFGKLQTVGNSDELFRLFLPSEEHATITVGMWLRPIEYPTIVRTGSSALFQFYGLNGTDRHTTITMTPTLELNVRNGNGTSLGTTDRIWQTINVGKYVEMQVVLSDTVGAVTIWVDGNVRLALTNVDTKNGSTTEYGKFHIDVPNLTYQYIQIDDVYITNGDGPAPYNGRLGDIVVETIFPDGNGNYNDFVGSDGNQVDNYLLVDEVAHDSDSTYVESGSDGARDSYEFQDLTVTTNKVRGVMISAVARNTGVADNFQILTRIASTDYNADTHTAGPNYDGSIHKIYQISPDTGVNWTAAEVNAAEFGIENVV